MRILDKFWDIEVKGNYIFIKDVNKAGIISIKSEIEGFVVDILDSEDEIVATTYALYNELEGEE